jgi:hypothetical protein
MAGGSRSLARTELHIPQFVLSNHVPILSKILFATHSSTLKIGDNILSSLAKHLSISGFVSCKSIALAAPQLKRLAAGCPPRRPGFNPGSGQVRFVVDKVALGQVFSEDFGFPCLSFHQILHPHNHPG